MHEHGHLGSQGARVGPGGWNELDSPPAIRWHCSHGSALGKTARQTRNACTYRSSIVSTCLLTAPAWHEWRARNQWRSSFQLDLPMAPARHACGNETHQCQDRAWRTGPRVRATWRIQVTGLISTRSAYGTCMAWLQEETTHAKIVRGASVGQGYLADPGSQHRHWKVERA